MRGLRFFPYPIRAYIRALDLCLNSEAGRGIWKRIDENRELLACIQEHAPDLLERCPFIDGWIAGTDIFLNDLATAFEIKVPEWMDRLYCPRPWPGKFNVEKCYEVNTPASCASSEDCDGEQAIGKN